jgi:aconitate hydratase
MFQARYADVFKGDKNWQAITSTGGETYQLARLDLCAEPALFRGHDDDAGAGHRHRRRAPLALLGDSITTDHISPAGSSRPD